MKLSKRAWNNIEAAVVVFLLLFAENLNIPDFLNTIINLVSYPVVMLLVVSTGVNKVAYLLTKDKILILLVGLAFVSIFWSEAPFETFTQIRGLARITIFGAYLATRYTIREQMRLLSWSVGIAAILSIFVCILIPSYGIQANHGVLTWQGIYTFKQYLGRIMALGASVYLTSIFTKGNNRLLATIALCLAVSLILLSNSKTGLIMFLISILTLPLYKVAKQQSIVRVILLFIILLISAGIVSIVIINLETIVVNFLGKDLEFNGRAEIWNLAIKKALERPFLGYGYVAFWPSDAGQYVMKNTWGMLLNNTHSWHAHNGFLEITLQLGLIGTFLMLFDLFVVIRKIITLLIVTKKMEMLWMLQFIAILFTWNMSEVITFLSASNIFWIIHVSIALSASLEYSRLHKDRQLHTFLDKAKIAI